MLKFVRVVMLNSESELVAMTGAPVDVDPGKQSNVAGLHGTMICASGMPTGTS